jgi:hypothetical protein
MKYYYLIKSAIILFFLFQVLVVIAQLPSTLSTLYFTGLTSDSLWGLATIILFIAAILAIVYYCIFKIDAILHFFNIHLLFRDDAELQVPNKVSSRWTSLVIIAVGIYVLEPALLDILVQGTTMVQNSVANSGYDYIIMKDLNDQNSLIAIILESICGLILITQAK